MKVLGIESCEVEGFGRLERLFLDHGARFTVVHPYRGEAIPTLRDFDAIVVGSTPVSAMAFAEHPFLRAEYRLLEHAVEAAIPCLGICFGAQVLARMLGATVERAPVAEIGTYEVELTAAGLRDPLLAGFPERFPVFQWHGDSFAIPEGGDLLVAGSACPNQAFRHGAVVGVQFHLEVTPAQARAWANAYRDEAAASGTTESAIINELSVHVAQMERLCDLVVTNLLGLASVAIAVTAADPLSAGARDRSPEPEPRLDSRGLCLASLAALAGILLAVTLFAIPLGLAQATESSLRAFWFQSIEPSAVGLGLPWAIALREVVSAGLCWVHDGVRDANGLLRLDHYFAFLCAAGALAAISVSPAVRRRRARYLPAIVYILVVTVFWTRVVLGIYNQIGDWVPLLLILLLWLVVPGSVLGATGMPADHFFELRPALEHQQLRPVDLVAGRTKLVVITMTGGGIQAAGWLTWVFRQLVTTRPSLVRETRLISAVSGGSVGLGFLIEALLRADGDADMVAILDHAHDRSVRSSLAAAAYGLAVPDTIRFVFLQTLPTLLSKARLWDRGRLLELAWQHNAGDGQPAGGRSLGELVPHIRSGFLPAPIINATALETGERILLTPLSLAGALGTTHHELYSPRHDLGLWTAARLSATFPYVSPAARAQAPLGALPGSRLHLIDGGYHDNSGIASALEALEEILDDPGTLERVAIVEIDAFAEEPSPDRTIPGWAASLLGPAQGAFVARERSQSERTDQALRRLIAAHSGPASRPRLRHFRFRPAIGDNGPLTWHLISDQKNRLRDAWFLNPANSDEARGLDDFLGEPPGATRPERVTGGKPA